ncbi:methyltransferase domain-containing protein [Alteromonas pelagimontana]|uniref:Methyltransferase domain-containing protein n=1 Tax=Alteromonas pelagimontana TaxID=1858656 RepID=A0A6M4MA04_9ALTE|nr:methyltransferase domain-containing protein [Alteromonas pelagimontana]QJR79799.1 methyltransferase domain-containing protein [Alteromonas pelagimontana]
MQLMSSHNSSSSTSEGQVKTVARQFSQAASRYNQIAEIQQVIAQHALKKLRFCASGKLLDIGCGTGRHTAELVAKGISAVGVDIAPGMIDYARTQYPHIHFFVADACTLPFADGSFSQVFSSMALQWSHSPTQALAEIYRVLQPAGRAVLAIMVDGSFAELDDARARCGLPITTNPQLSQGCWITAAKTAGFTQVHSRQQAFTDHFDHILPLLRSIKSVGAGALTHKVNGNKSLSRQDLAALNGNYHRISFKDEEVLPLTYQVLQLRLEK